MNEEIRNLVGGRLKEERERLAWSQAVLAEVATVSKRSVAAWESGETAPGADVLALLSVKGVDVLYVLTGQRTPQAVGTLSAEESALLDNYNHSDEEGRAAARRVLSSLAQPQQKRA